LDKTTAILGGIYGGIVLLMIFVFFISPQKTDVTNDPTGANYFGQILSKNSGMSLADLFAKSDESYMIKTDTS